VRVTGQRQDETVLRIGTVVLGVDDLQRALAFWSAALGYAPRYEPDVDWVILDPTEGHGASIALSQTRAKVVLRGRCQPLTCGTVQRRAVAALSARSVTSSAAG
jgi:catechol 2,3-dioxygenase-like lactoylglutathione lyase family enzyme